jgi:bifunctional DNA-binding transcriptional regulator/antitoxin component of YhaV-PrlF toxin-antitoxin module
MRFEAKVGERGEIVIPTEVHKELRLVPETTVEVDVTPANSCPAEREPDWQKLNALVARLRLPMRDALLADGYLSVDAYIDDLRGR